MAGVGTPARLQIRSDLEAMQNVRGLLGGLIVRLRRLRATMHRARHRREWVIFDSVDPAEIPKHARAVAGYVGGRWPTYAELLHQFPDAKVEAIAISATETAHTLDVEMGDATPQQVPAWVRRMQQTHGLKFRPGIYAAHSTMVEVVAELHRAGIKREEVRLWLADPTGKPHIPPGYDACQWWWKALGRNLDQSAGRPDFFG